MRVAHNLLWRFSGPRRTEGEDLIKVQFDVGHRPAPPTGKRNQRLLVDEVASAVRAGAVEWLEPGPETWVVDAQRAKSEFAPLRNVAWFDGRLSVEPEVEWVEDAAFPAARYKTFVNLYVDVSAPKDGVVTLSSDISVTTEKPKWYGPWRVIKGLGAGAQGEVFLVRRLPRKQYEALNEHIFQATAAVRFEEGPLLLDYLFDAFRAFSESEAGALKVLHSPERAKNPATAERRFARELQALRDRPHRGLIKLLDHDEAEKRWFVMEYYPRGTLTQSLARYAGDLIASLSALRPVVEAVASLHEHETVHRDIKPDNIFVGGDGGLVLGDFGLVFEPGQAADRVSGTAENVGSRQWMPLWAQDERLEDVPPSFDVFSLGKVIWSMLSGKKFMRFHYFRDDQFNLERQFDGAAWALAANALLHKCITERKGDGLQNAGELLREMDKLTSGADR